jgi:hypothetical protein
VECESKYDTSNNGVTGTFQNHSHSTWATYRKASH